MLKFQFGFVLVQTTAENYEDRNDWEIGTQRTDTSWRISMLQRPLWHEVQHLSLIFKTLSKAVVVLLLRQSSGWLLPLLLVSGLFLNRWADLMKDRLSRMCQISFQKMDRACQALKLVAFAPSGLRGTEKRILNLCCKIPYFYFQLKLGSVIILCHVSTIWLNWHFFQIIGARSRFLCCSREKSKGRLARSSHWVWGLSCNVLAESMTRHLMLIVSSSLIRRKAGWYTVPYVFMRLKSDCNGRPDKSETEIRGNLMGKFGWWMVSAPVELKKIDAAACCHFPYSIHLLMLSFSCAFLVQVRL